MLGNFLQFGQSQTFPALVCLGCVNGKDPVGLVTVKSNHHDRRAATKRTTPHGHPRAFCATIYVARVFFFFVALLSRYSNVMLRPVGGVEETLRIVHQLVRAERLSPQRFASFARPHLHAPWMGHVCCSPS